MSNYRGRFAPSPTGPLHFGSLFGAVISYLEAKANKGSWFIRIEDIDPLREQPGASAAILETLSRHGLHSDVAVIFQSQRSALYEDVLNNLQAHNFVFGCPCSRKYLLEHQGIHHPACGKDGFVQNKTALKFRSQFQSQQACLSWNDLFQGVQSLTLEEDFVLKRKEGFYAYQLAVVCDDISQEITHVIRGYDLLDSTPMQLALYQALERKPPFFGHFPVIVNSQGQKLSKQNLARAIDNDCPEDNLRKVFNLLNIHCPKDYVSCQYLLDNAIAQWQSANLTNIIQIPELEYHRDLQQ